MNLHKTMTIALLVCALAFIPAQGADAQPQSSAGEEEHTKQEEVFVSDAPDVKSKSKGKCPKCGMDLRVVDQGEAGVTSHEVDTPTAIEVSMSGQTSKMNIPDIEVLDQNGRKLHFYTDLVKGQTVVINFIFTTCTTICPPLGATFARVQKELGDKVGRCGR